MANQDHSHEDPKSFTTRTAIANEGAKEKKPSGLKSKLIQVAPVALTVLATALAGMSSGEMTQSMYYRSLASQHQSKAGDQWSFFQAKRIRGTSLEGNVQLLRNLAHIDRLDVSRLKNSFVAICKRLEPLSADSVETGRSVQTKLERWIADAQTNGSLKFLIGPDLPKVEDKLLPNNDENKQVWSAIQAMSRRHSEAELAGLVTGVPMEKIEEAAGLAELNAEGFDKACETPASALKQLRSIAAEITQSVQRFPRPSASDATDNERVKLLGQLHSEADEINSTIETTANDFDARRYRQESVYNRKAAELYELRVARSGVQSDTHRDRSKKFFFAMLMAQAGVTVASLALARQNHSMFWVVAAVAGCGALGLSGITYFSLV